MKNIHRAIANNIQNKHSDVYYSRFRNIINVYLTDYELEEGVLNLEFSKELVDGSFIPIVQSKYKLPSNLIVELPKVLMGLLQDLDTVEMLVYYKEYLVLAKSLVIKIRVLPELYAKISQENLEYNTGFSGNIEKQEDDIAHFGKRDSKKVDSLYLDLLKLLKEHELSSEQVKISPLNTVEYVMEDESIHLSYSSLIAKDSNDYKILYDLEDRNISKSATLKYLVDNYEDEDLSIIQKMLELL